MHWKSFQDCVAPLNEGLLWCCINITEIMFEFIVRYTVDFSEYDIVSSLNSKERFFPVAYAIGTKNRKLYYFRKHTVIYHL